MEIVFIRAINCSYLICLFVLLTTDYALIHPILNILIALFLSFKRLYNLCHWNSIKISIFFTSTQNYSRYKAAKGGANAAKVKEENIAEDNNNQEEVDHPFAI